MLNKEQEEQLMKEDLYGLLGVEPEATEKEIRKAWRKTALKFHPDKNPDDKNAAEKFHHLSMALAILADEDKRIQYDVKRKAKQRQKQQLDELDKAKRQRREDLDHRERMGHMEAAERKAAETREKQMREQGARILAEELRRMKEEIEQERRTEAESRRKARAKASTTFKLKFKYNANTLTTDQTKNLLESALGEDALIVFSRKKKSSGIIQTTKYEKARELVNDPLDSNNLRISWQETPIPPTHNLHGLTEAQRQFFMLEADVLTALRKAAAEDRSSDSDDVVAL